MHIKLKAWNGIGDALFATPPIRCIKEAYPRATIEVSTHYPVLFSENPFVDSISRTKPRVIAKTDEDGVYLSYPDPRSAVRPQFHLILHDWRILCAHYGLKTKPPELRPEIYCVRRSPRTTGAVLVQTEHRNQWFGKKVWPFFNELPSKFGFTPIPRVRTIYDLIRLLASARAVVCAEGGVSHLAAALGVPCVVVYGGFAIPEWNGYDYQVNLQHRTPCSPCWSGNPCDANRACLTSITVDHVVDAVCRVLRRDRG